MSGTGYANTENHSSGSEGQAKVQELFCLEEQLITYVTMFAQFFGTTFGIIFSGKEEWKIVGICRSSERHSWSRLRRGYPRRRVGSCVFRHEDWLDRWSCRNES